jgi:hypothetical protein
MFGLQDITNVLTRIIREAKSAIDRIILNTELWEFKTDDHETALSDNFGQILRLDRISLSEKKLKQNKSIHKHIEETNEENSKYLLSEEYWECVFKLSTIDTAYTEFLKPLTCYFDTTMSLRKVKISKLKKKHWITCGICKSSERLKFIK